MRVFPRRHRSIPPLEGFACRPVPLYHPAGRGVPNPASRPDSPTSLLLQPSPTFLASTEMVAPAGLEPARIRPHRAAPSCRHTPNLTERNGTSHGRLCPAARTHISTARLPDLRYLSRPDTRLPPFGDSDLLRTALLLRRTLKASLCRLPKSSVFLHGALCGSDTKASLPIKRRIKDMKGACGSDARGHDRAAGSSRLPCTGAGRAESTGTFRCTFRQTSD